MTVRLAVFLMLSLAMATGCATPIQARDETLGVAEYGSLVVETPSGWVAEETAEVSALPTIKFTPEVGDEFTILVSAIARGQSNDPAFGSAEAVYQIVAGTARDTQPHAVEPALQIREIGDGATGYFFWATDKSLASKSRIPPGEYLHLTQGAIMVGDLLCVFTILTNDRPSGVIDQALQMLRRAEHRIEM